MALAATLTDYFDNGNKRAVGGTLAFDSAYVTGGEALSAQALGLGLVEKIMVYPKNGYVFEYDHTNAKMKVFDGRSQSVLFIGTTPVASLTASETDLMTYSVPGGTLGTIGQIIRVKAWGITANNANAKTVIAYFGTQALVTRALTASQVNTWVIEALIMRLTATTQEAIATIIQGGTTAFTGATDTAPAMTLSAAQVVKCTGTAPTGASDITQNGMLVELYNPTAAGALGSEVPNAADLSSLTGVRFVAMGF